MRNDTSLAPTAPTDPGDGGRVCPQCGEPVRRTPPAARLPWSAHRLPVPQWSHTDGEPLCPVVTDCGYQPAGPAEAA